MIKYKDKYRIESTRLPSWDYGSNAPYYVTICTKNKQKYFGKIVNNKVELNDLGKVTQKSWLAIPQFHSFVEIDEFIIMPNHLHGIIVINKPLETQFLASKIHLESVETRYIVSKNTNKSETQSVASLQKNKFGPQSQNLASIIRGFKSGVTQYAREHKIAFHWQSRYYDHIIRNYESWEMVRQYIQQNPIDWLNDKEFIA